jgi:transcriptional regulator with XRE-family HTH domain
VQPELKKAKFRILPPEERAIAKRLARLRRQSVLTQTELAEAVGLTRDQLASIETARVTLPFKVARKLQQILHFNLRWLATGIEPGFVPIAIDEELLKEACKHEGFLTAYNTVLREPTEKEFAILKEEWERDNPGSDFDRIAGLLHPGRIGAQEMDRINTSLLPWLTDALQNMPAPLREDLSIKVGRLINSFETEHRTEIQRFKNKNIGKDNLDCHRKLDTLTGMSLDVPTWAQLKKAVIRLTSRRGQKAALAEKLGVSRQVLGNWLSSDDQGAPNAELTLKVFRWVMEHGGWKPK